MLLTSQRAGNPLAAPASQLQVLQDWGVASGVSFQQTLMVHGTTELNRPDLRTLQVNLGKVCNQTCSHCHVDAGPDRRESMNQETARHVIEFLSRSPADTLDITGGAPEMNENFRWLVTEARRLGKHVIDRCNLTILMANGYRDLPEFLAENQVQVIASLPCYLESNCDAQRGNGVFQKSIAAIQTLNALGYAQPGSGLVLDLVYNPTGLGLPPDAQSLEADYKTQLGSRYQIQFDNLLTITNMPISRFLDDLLQQHQLNDYMDKLVRSFNSKTIERLMCRSLISVDWNGYVYDCDFNQMLDMAVTEGQTKLHLSQLSDEQLQRGAIRVANHCFGCTAGRGSSCGGSLT